MTIQLGSHHSFRAFSRYHTQDLTDSCGAAVAMTILELAGVPIAGISQETELEIAKAMDLGKKFAMTPTALVSLLNSRLEIGGSSERYQAKYFDRPEDCLGNLLACVRTGWPSVTLLYGYHWGVVDGYEIDSTGRLVTAIWLHNPVKNPPVGDGIPPHTSPDKCGSGGALGCADEVLTSSIWSTDCFLESTQLKLQFDAYYVSIGVQAPSPPVKPALYAETPSVTPQALLGGLVEVSAEVFPEYAASLRNTHLGEAIEVVPIDDRMARYSLTALNSSMGRVFWVQTRGENRIPLALAQESDPQPPVVTENAAQMIAEALRPGVLAAEVSTGFVWKLCPESYSPFLPFREVRMSEGEKIYVRSDGVGFLDLGDVIPGG
jgi:hypothetical protein